jgi:hypothetical protein
MNIEYKNYSKNYGTISYSVDVICKDDGAHFPRFSYTGYILLKGDDVDKSDDEIYAMVIEDMKNNYMKFNHITLDEQFEDPAFERIKISVKKDIFYDKKIEITK